MRFEGFEVTGQLTVLPHAVVQARARIPECRCQKDDWIKTEVARRVREAIHNGDIYDVVPKRFRLYGIGRASLGSKVPPWQRIVTWRDGAFIVDFAELPHVQVITVFKQVRP